MKFTKMHGAGNDFVVLDAVRQTLNLTPDLIRRLADRHFGVGADQVLIVEPPENPANDFRYRIFNQDGSEVEQCGNGARCFAQYVVQSGLSDKTTLRVETQAGVITPQLEAPGRVKVDMGSPSFTEAAVHFDAANLNTRQVNKTTFYTIDLPETLQIKQTTVEFSVVSMGNPHAVILVESLAQAPVQQLGKYLERHPRFAAKINVGFLQIVDRSAAGLRVWERGAGETLACGTGACAAAVVGMQMGVFDHQVNIQKRGGLLTIAWQAEGASVYMTGPAKTVFEGEWLDSTS
jgi:diaminopimelate epimerase